MWVPFGERPAGGDDKTDLGGGSFERFGGPSLKRALHRRLVVTTAKKLKQSVAMMRQIRMQPRPAAVAAAVQPSDLVVVIIRVLAVAAQVPPATEFDRRIAHFNRHALAPPTAQPPEFGCGKSRGADRGLGCRPDRKRRRQTGRPATKG